MKAAFFLVAVLGGCAATRPPPVCAARLTLIDARDELGRVLALTEREVARVEADLALLDAIASARAAYETERYSDAVADLSLAVRLLESLPSDTPARIEVAAELLTMAGR